MGEYGDAGAAPGCPKLDDIRLTLFEFGDFVAFDVSVTFKCGGGVADGEGFEIFLSECGGCGKGHEKRKDDPLHADSLQRWKREKVPYF